MKKFKRAFTLAELLLCIGIIGIVSAMGMVITKHSTDKAYQLYYYTGYINLYNAIADGKANNLESINDIMQHAEDLLKRQENQVASVLNNDLLLLTYKASYVNDRLDNSSHTDLNSSDSGQGMHNEEVKHCWEGLVYVPGKGCVRENPKLDPGKLQIGNGAGNDSENDGGNDGGNNNGNDNGNDNGNNENNNGNDNGNNENNNENNENVVRHTFIANNGIVYEYSVGSNTTGGILIRMSVPAAKTRTNNGYQEETFYFSNDDKGYLIPLSPADGSTSPNLQVRKDLLPVYIDDGNVGRNNVVDRTKGFEYKRPIYGSYRDAYCSINQNSLSFNGTEVINCTADTYTDIRPVVSGTRVNGILKVANPQKAR